MQAVERIIGIGGHRALSGFRQKGYLALGFLMLALGVIGALLPLMPTTIFLILAAGCFARSSPRLEAWLMNHPRIGSSLRGWREHGIVPRRAKYMACLGMTAGYAMFWLGAKPGPALAIVVALAMAGCAAYVTTRPEHPKIAD